MAKGVGLLFTVLLVAALVAGCAQPAPAPEKPAAATPAAKPAESKPAESKPAAATPAAKAPDKPTAAPAAAAKPAIKIGYLTPLTGVYAALGADLKDGFALYLEEKGGQLAGRKIEVLVEDSEAKPDVGLTKAKKLVERDNVQMLAGVIHSGVALGLAPYAKEKKIPLFIHNAGADDLTKKEASPYIFRISFANSMNTHPVGEWAYKKGLRKAAIVSSDYAAGWEYSGGFARTFTEAGGQIVQELYHPLGAADLSPYITAIKPEVDVVYSFNSGADALKFVKTYEEYGVKKRAALIGPGGLTDDSILPQQGDAALGTFTSGNYTTALANPENKTFMAAFTKKFNRPVTYFAEHGYAGAMMLEKALQAVQGNMEDSEKFLAALAKAEVPNAPRGPIKLDQYRNIINNIYIMETKKVDGKLVNVPIETFKDVSQFWKWSPDEFTKMPTYTDAKGKWAK
ncbi:MAG: ABC transporter substrate-binding protein [Chloroflexi bacterium]|nr:ABC transporter substrate-binding protein [Chloroflexota bacterium]